MDGAAIVQLSRDRDERAIPAASAEYGTYCTAIAESILGSAEDAEECVNDPYLNAWSAFRLTGRTFCSHSLEGSSGTCR